MDPFRIAPAAAVPGLYSPPIIFFIFSIHMVSFSAPASVAKTSRLTRAVSPTFSITICGLARRGVFLAHSQAAGTVGLLAGLVGATVLQLRCPLIEASHSAVWHAGIVVASGLTGMLTGRLSALCSTAP